MNSKYMQVNIQLLEVKVIFILQIQYKTCVFENLVKSYICIHKNLYR